MKIRLITLAAVSALALGSCTPADIENTPSPTATPEMVLTAMQIGDSLPSQEGELTLQSVTFARAINDGSLVCQYDDEVKYIDIIWNVKNSTAEPLYLNELLSATLHTAGTVHSHFRYFVSGTSLIAFNPVIEAGAEETVHMFTSLPLNEDTASARLEIISGNTKFAVSSGFLDVCDFQEKTREAYTKMEQITKELSDKLESSWSFSYPYSPDEVRTEMTHSLQNSGAKSVLNELNSVAPPQEYSAGYELLLLQTKNFVSGCERIVSDMNWDNFDCVAALRNLINAYKSEEIMTDILASMPYLTDKYVPRI